MVQQVESTPGNRATLAERQARGCALEVMEGDLAEPVFAANRLTIADNPRYTYAHLAHEGASDLVPLPAIRRSPSRVQAQPGHLRIDALPPTIRAADSE